MASFIQEGLIWGGMVSERSAVCQFSYNSFCVYWKTQIFINISLLMPESFTTFSGLIIQQSSITGDSNLQLKNISWNFSACITLMENHHIAFAASILQFENLDVQKRVLSSA